MFKKILLITLCILPLFAIAVEKNVVASTVEETQPATWIGPWLINCHIEKFPSVTSASRYSEGARHPIHLCSAEQTISLTNSRHDLTLTAKLTPFYFMFTLHNMIADNRYTKLFIGNRDPWHLYANCYDIPGDQSCIFWLGDANDLARVKKALFKARDFMVQMTEKHTGQSIHFVFSLDGYPRIISAMNEAASAIHYAYRGLHGTDEV